MSNPAETRFFQITAAFDDASLLLNDREQQHFLLEPTGDQDGEFVLREGPALDLRRRQIIDLRSIFEELFGKPGVKGKTGSPFAFGDSTRFSEEVAHLIARYVRLKGQCVTYRDAIAQKTDSTPRFQGALIKLERDMEGVVAALRAKIETLDEFEFA